MAAFVCTNHEHVNRSFEGEGKEKKKEESCGGRVCCCRTLCWGSPAACPFVCGHLQILLFSFLPVLDRFLVRCILGAFWSNPGVFLLHFRCILVHFSAF